MVSFFGVACLDDEPLLALEKANHHDGHPRCDALHRRHVVGVGSLVVKVDERRVRPLRVQVDECGVAAHVGTRDRQPGCGERVGDNVARKVVAGDDEGLPVVERERAGHLAHSLA